MISVKKQRITAIVVLSSIVLLLFLSLNFRIWGGYYTEGDLENVVIQQMDRLEKSDSKADRNKNLFFRFYECLCFFSTAIMLLLADDRFIELCQGSFSFRPGVTLRSLSVRMDN